MTNETASKNDSHNSTPSHPTISVTNEELRTTRELVREMNSTLELLDSGSLQKVVVTRSGKIVGVLVSPETFSRLSGSS